MKINKGSKAVSLAFVLLISVNSSLADYFDDQGIKLGKFRTDYNSQTEGSSSNPLSLGTGCYYPQSEFGTEIFIKVHRTQACPTGPTVYPGGPYPFSGGPFNQSSYWVVSANVELSYENNSTYAPLGTLQGAPNLSTSLTSSPDLMSFYTVPVFNTYPYLEPDFYRANLIVDNEGTTGAKYPAAIPFLAFGGQKNRGNNGNVGQINVAGKPDKTTWKSTIKISSGVGSGVVKTHIVYAIAVWGGKQRMVQITLYHYSLEYSSSSVAGIHRHWNWPASNSFHYPGADIAFADAEDLVSNCGSGVGTVPRITSLGAKYVYTIDWGNVFRCMSDKGLFDDPMPYTSVPILGVHWAVETFGDTTVWAVVEDAFML